MEIDPKKLRRGHYEAKRSPHPASSNGSVPDFAFNILNPVGLLYRPILDEQHIDAGGQRPNWPEGRSFAVCLTHDVDFVSSPSLIHHLRSRLTRLLSYRPSLCKIKKPATALISLLTGTNPALKNDPFHSFQRWLEIEKDVGGHSTFFFWPGWSNVSRHHISDCTYELFDKIAFDGHKSTVAEMIREMDHRGWEIGLHPSWHACTDLEELRRQKDALETILGHEVKSVRHHFLHYDIQKTPRIQSDAGFKFDSTLGFNDNIGFRFGTSYGWRLYDLISAQHLCVVEIPLIIQDTAMLNCDKGMRLDASMAFEYIEQMTETVESVGGILTLSFHPNYIVDPSYWGLYCKTLAYLNTKKPWFGSVSQIGNWFKQNHLEQQNPDQDVL